MSEGRLITADIEVMELVVPASASLPALRLDISKIKMAESRIVEAQAINPSSYGGLEYVMNEGYREGKRHLSALGYQVTLAQKQLKEAHSIAIIDHYNDFLKEKKLKDSASVRDAFLQTRQDYVEAQDRINMLNAFESLIDGKVKNFESVCRYMRKQMDLIVRSGTMGDIYGR